MDSFLGQELVSIFPQHNFLQGIRVGEPLCCLVHVVYGDIRGCVRMLFTYVKLGLSLSNTEFTSKRKLIGFYTNEQSYPLQCV